MAKKKAAQEPAIRKSFLITGGVAIAAVLLGFVVMNFVLGGDDPTTGGPISTPSVVGPGAAASTPDPTPQPSDVPGLKPGGRDPFAIGSGQAPAATPAPAPVEVAGTSTQSTTSDGSDPKPPAGESKLTSDGSDPKP